MAGNQVVLSFAGETKPLEESFDRVGSSSESMGKKVGSATRDLDEHANGLGKVGEAADNSERNIIGVHDVIDGTATIMQGPGKQGIVAYIQGWADLAGGLAPLLLTLAETKFATIAQTVASKTAAVGTKVWAAAQWIMNASMYGFPLVWIIAAIVAVIAIIVVIAKKTDWFSQAWAASWKWVKSAASDAWDFIKKIPGWIGSAFAKVAGFISAPYRAAFNLIASAWNNTIGRLSWKVPGWIPGIGGNTISVPQLPHFHSGGVVPGTPGSEQLAVLQAGEKVTSASGSGATETVIVKAGDDVTEWMIETLTRGIGRRGGNVQVVLGTGRG